MNEFNKNTLKNFKYMVFVADLNILSFINSKIVFQNNHFPIDLFGPWAARWIVG